MYVRTRTSPSQFKVAGHPWLEALCRIPTRHMRVSCASVSCGRTGSHVVIRHRGCTNAMVDLDGLVDVTVLGPRKQRKKTAGKSEAKVV